MQKDFNLYTCSEVILVYQLPRSYNVSLPLGCLKMVDSFDISTHYQNPLYKTFLEYYDKL